MSRPAARCRAARRPTACAIRPQLGSPPCSAVLTSGELATRAARRARRSAPWPPRTTTRPMRRAPSPSRTMSMRELAQQRVERLAEEQLVLGLRLDRDAAGARCTCRIAVSLVESWPSTEMRSNERLTQTPSSRSAVSADDAASVCTKHSIVAKAGWIMPAPLACAPAAPSRPSGRPRASPRFSNASVVMIAAGSRRRRRARSALPAASSPRTTVRRRAARR